MEYELQVGQQRAPVLVSDVGFLFAPCGLNQDDRDEPVASVKIKVNDQSEETLNPDS